MDVTVVAGPATEMHALVSKGTVDGFNGISIGDAVAFKVSQYAKSCTVVKGGVFTPIFVLMVNQGTWDALDAADQKAIESVSGESFARLSAAVDDWNNKVTQGYVDQGGTIITPSDAFNATMTEKWAPMQAAWIEKANAAGLDGQAVYDYYKSQVAAVLAE
jgi:TRAP-type C4-dicarboxylate transport system substrate-binding protein